ncbi:hypothetical protein B0H17DRAFT_1334941 [Mycena rosella]|uniref:Uncharacterized protein n=1 Tax=Mycena rosella TaxID=1033263 RepID=A0AAD7D1R8_MYCRO|nr:hypothetical protein B0H17DRAFT_1334941 [Mycena rosella]
MTEPNLLLPPPVTTLLQASIPNPITVFTGPSCSAAATANDNRNVAIARHFPKPNYRPPHAYPANTAKEETFQAQVLLWPNVGLYEPLGSAVPGFVYTTYTIDEFTEMMVALKAHGLSFIAVLPSSESSNLVDKLSSQLTAHIASHNLVLPRMPESLGPVTDPVPWFRRPFMHASANGNNFNRKFILDMNSKFTNPDIEHSSLPLIVLAPRFDHVQGPLPPMLSPDALYASSHPEALHSCFGQQILHGLPYSGRYRILECHVDLCPDYEPSPPVTAPPRWAHNRERTPEAMVASSSGSRVRARSLLSVSPAPPPIRRRLNPVFIEVNSSDDDDFEPAPLLHPQRNPPRSSTLPATLPEPTPTQIVLGTGAKILEWKQSIWFCADTVADSATVKIHGTSITANAEFIISLFYYLRSKDLNSSLALTFPSLAKITCPRISMTHFSFLQSQAHHSYSVGSGSSLSVGGGVEQSVWRRVLALVVEESVFWTPALVEPGHITFNLSPIADGIEDHKIRPLVHDGLSDPMPTDVRDPLYTLIINLFGVMPVMIATPRTQAEHNGWTISICSHRLLGYDAPWNHDDFVSTQAGFNIPCQETCNQLLLLDITPLKAASLIAGMYHRQVTSLADDVFAHLSFATLPAIPPPDVNLMSQLFELRFKRYLSGSGHPSWFQSHGMIAEAEMATGLSTPFLCTHLLLLTAVESTLLPIQDKWTIKFTTSSLLQQPTENIALHMREPSPLHFHTCSGTIDVRVNPKLFDLMIKSPEGDEETEFDVWAHTELYNADLAARPSRAPRRPDDEFSVAIPPTECNPLDLTMGSRQGEETPLDISIASEINPSVPIQGEGVTEEAIGGPLVRQPWVLPSQHNSVIDPPSGYIINSSDPAADILQELLVLLPTHEDDVTSEDSPPSLLDSEFSNELTGERNSLTEAQVLFTDPVEDVPLADMNATIGAPSSPGNTPQIIYFCVLASLGLDNSTLMFVLYVYPEDTNPLSIVSVHSAGVLPAAASMSSAMTDAMRGYLELHYAS